MKKILFLFSFLATLSLCAQEEDAWFFLIDKPNVEAFLENPLTMLSQRAIDRRNNLQIALDDTDVPVYESYLDAIKNVAGITVLGKSKWLISRISKENKYRTLKIIKK